MPSPIAAALVCAALSACGSPPDSRSAGGDGEPSSNHRDSRGSGASEDGADPPAPLPRIGDQNRIDALDDPESDGWDSEVLASAIADQWKHFAHWLEEPSEDLSDIAEPGALFPPLRPSDLGIAYQPPRRFIRVLRARAPREATTDYTFEEAAAKLRRFLSARELDHAKFKVVSIALTSDGAVTRQLFEAHVTGERDQIEFHAEWEAAWVRGEGGAPLLRSITVLSHEETLSNGGPWFGDATAAALGANPSYQSQILRGMNDFAEGIQERRSLALMGAPGIAVGDADGDGPTISSCARRAGCRTGFSCKTPTAPRAMRPPIRGWAGSRARAPRSLSIWTTTATKTLRRPPSAT
ncbi:MAG: hypothetical protein R3F11_08705 [Verrucomicrobiales bacterium]